MARMADNAAIYAGAEQRIEYLSVAIGAAGAIIAAVFWGFSAGAGLAIGALLSWINFRWMRHGIGVLARLSIAQENAGKPRVPRTIYVKLIGRYALLIAAAYVILRGFGSMARGLLCGLFAVVAAVLIEALTLLLRSGWAGLSPP
jgi:ATP synthase I chain